MIAISLMVLELYMSNGYALHPIKIADKVLKRLLIVDCYQILILFSSYCKVTTQLAH